MADERGEGLARQATGGDGARTPWRLPRSGRARAGLAVTVVLVLLAAAWLVGTRPGSAAPPEPSLAAPVSASPGDVFAYPVPGTAVVHPEAQLSFRGLSGTDLGEVTVVGSESGEHAGTLLEHSDGDGVSFLPDEPFAEGEDVTVDTGHDVAGAEDGSYTLGIAELGTRPALEAPPVEVLMGGPADPDGDLQAQYVRQYPSAPGIEPPQVEVTGTEAGTVGDAQGPSGLTAIGVKNGYGQKGPMLVDDTGEPVWFLPLEGVDARDVQVQTYAGEPVLTWWEGLMGKGYGYGEGVIMDASYTEVARVRMAGGYDADSHEVRLTDEGTALLVGYEPVRMDLSDVGGPADGQVVDNVVQEIDLATGALRYEWHSVGQVAIDESYLELEDGDGEDGAPYDYFHVNSVDVDDDGDLLISARHTCAVYSLDRDTGSLEWRLGGRKSDFAMGEGTTFLKQHDARRSDDGTLTLFDNGGTCGDTTREVSRGIALDVDEAAMTVELAREYVHPDEVFAESQANFQELPGGDVFLGWGSVPRFTLMDAGGQVLLDGAIPDDLDVTSYRAHRVEWTGEPTTDPSAVVVTSDGPPVVHVSWNGATDVVSWRVVSSSGAELAAAPRGGFETVLPLRTPELPTGDLRVHALDTDGQVIGETSVPR